MSNCVANQKDFDGVIDKSVTIYRVGVSGSGSRQHCVDGFSYDAKTVWLYKSKVSAQELADIWKDVCNYQIKRVYKSGVEQFVAIEPEKIVLEYGEFFSVLADYAVHSCLQKDGSYAEPIFAEIVLSVGGNAVVTDISQPDFTQNFTEQLVKVK